MQMSIVVNSCHWDYHSREKNYPVVSDASIPH